ncbi:MAG: DUF1080 domain-containing protein [Phycisphaerae bacterium]
MHHRLTWLTLACLVIAGTALAAPEESEVQGLYEGVCAAGGGRQKVEARVVATGNGKFDVFLREMVSGGGTKALGKIEGKTEGDTVRFAGKVGGTEWSGAWSGGAIAGTCGTGKFALKRVVRKPPTLGKEPPENAVVLLAVGEKDFDEVVVRKDKKGNQAEWVPGDDGGFVVPKRGFNSKQRFTGPFRAHVEFKVPLKPKARSQGRGNSGVYLPNGNEIQVLDSFGMTTYTGGGCGGLYKWKDPDAFDAFSLASLPPGQWQTYDIEYRVDTKDGKPTGKPRITVWHNGIRIHDNVELKGNARAGNFHFQDHGNPVQYRNIWVAPLE